jgi:tetratricopeptide (TPR) repeat protein
MPPDNAAMESPYFHLGVTLHELDRPRDALEYFQRARTVIERNHPENSPRFVRVFMAMGSTYDRLGDAEPAFGLLTRAVTMQEEATGPDNRDLTFPLNNLAAFHMRHGNFPEAVRHYERSVAIMRESRADDLEPVLREYARALRATGDSAKAATIEAQAGGG